jgi:hypothetical protein
MSSEWNLYTVKLSLGMLKPSVIQRRTSGSDTRGRVPPMTAASAKSRERSSALISSER